MKRIYFSVLAAAFLFSGCEQPQKINKKQLADFCLNGQKKCDYDIANNKISLKTNVAKVIPEHPFNLVVTFDDINPILKVSGYLEGVSMYMGKVPLLFIKQKAEGNYRAEAFLGSCSDPKMQWRVVLTIEYQQGDKIFTKQLVDNFYSYRNE